MDWKPLDFRSRVYLFRHSNHFTFMVGFFIVAYSLVLGVEVSSIGLNENGLFYYILSKIDYIITLVFCIEIIIKIYTEKKWRDFFKDSWNTFDFIVIVISLIPLSTTDSLLILRLLRITRVLRLVTASDKLKHLISILWSALPSIFNIVLLIFIITYIYAVLGATFYSDAPSGMWNNVPIALLTLFQVLTFESWASDVMYEAMEINGYAWIFFVSYIIINAFIIFNLFVAVIIDEVTKIREINVGKFGIQEDRYRSDMLKRDLDSIAASIEKLKEKIEVINNNEKR